MTMEVTMLTTKTKFKYADKQGTWDWELVRQELISKPDYTQK